MGVADSIHFRDTDPLQQHKQNGTQLVCGLMEGQGAAMFCRLSPPQSNLFQSSSIILKKTLQQSRKPRSPQHRINMKQKHVYPKCCCTNCKSELLTFIAVFLPHPPPTLTTSHCFSSLAGSIFLPPSPQLLLFPLLLLSY